MSCACHLVQCLTTSASDWQKSGISPTYHWLEDSFHAAVTCSGTVGKSVMFCFLSHITWDYQQLSSALHLPLKGSWTELQCLSPFWDIHSQAAGRNEGAGDTDQHTVGSEDWGRVDWMCILSLLSVSSLLRWEISNRVKLTISYPPGQAEKIQDLRVTVMESSLLQPRLHEEWSPGSLSIMKGNCLTVHPWFSIAKCHHGGGCMWEEREWRLFQNLSSCLRLCFPAAVE